VSVRQWLLAHLCKDPAQLDACEVPLLVECCWQVGEEHADGAHAVIKVVQQAVNLREGMGDSCIWDPGRWAFSPANNFRGGTLLLFGRISSAVRSLVCRTKRQCCVE
jgi:hypothetical protein